MGLTLPRDAEDLRAPAAQPFQCQHVNGHLSRVSPHDPLDANSIRDGRRWFLPLADCQVMATVPDDKHRVAAQIALLPAHERPIFRRICGSKPVHHGPADRPIRRVRFRGVQGRRHVSRAVVGKALARSAGHRGPPRRAPGAGVSLICSKLDNSTVLHRVGFSGPKHLVGWLRRSSSNLRSWTIGSGIVSTRRVTRPGSLPRG